MRRNLAISSFKCSISASRDNNCSCCAVICSCCATISATSASGSSFFRSESVVRSVIVRAVCQNFFLVQGKNVRKLEISKENCATGNTHDLHCQLRSLRANRPPPVDPFEQHRQLCRRQGHRSTGRLRPHESAALQPLCEQAQPVSVPPQHLDEIPTFPSEDEYLA